MFCCKFANERAADLHVANAGQQSPGHQLCGQGPPLGAAHTHKPASALVAAVLLDPGPCQQPAHRKPQEIHRLAVAKGVNDLRVEARRQGFQWNLPQAVLQMGNQQWVATAIQLFHEPSEQFRGVPQPVDEHQRGMLRHVSIERSRSAISRLSRDHSPPPQVARTAHMTTYMAAFSQLGGSPTPIGPA